MIITNFTKYIFKEVPCTLRNLKIQKLAPQEIDSNNGDNIGVVDICKKTSLEVVENYRLTTGQSLFSLGIYEIASLKHKNVNFYLQGAKFTLPQRCANCQELNISSSKAFEINFQTRYSQENAKKSPDVHSRIVTTFLKATICKGSARLSLQALRN